MTNHLLTPLITGAKNNVITRRATVTPYIRANTCQYLRYVKSTLEKKRNPSHPIPKAMTCFQTILSSPRLPSGSILVERSVITPRADRSISGKTITMFEPKKVLFLEMLIGI